MVNIRNFFDKAHEDAVAVAYMSILGRQPESEDIIRDNAREGKSIKNIIDELKSSNEYKYNKKMSLMDEIIKVKKENISKIVTTERAQDDVIMVQTSDNVRYSKILNVSSKYNEEYCYKHKINYQKYKGICKGVHPHHATFNRIFMLKEIVDRGFSGWVCYVDADAIVRNNSFSLKENLSALRKKNKHMWLHSVFNVGEDNYNWWDINAGCFAIDLSFGICKEIINVWYEIYSNLYSIKEYEAATRWDDIIDDQISFQHILKIFDVEVFCEIGKMQDEFFFQALRSVSHDVSPEAELLMRMTRLEEEGRRIFGDC
ncbi:hypothetical protein HLH26_03240 [Gluconacetobacter sp. 1b LMG 1731]|uniref:Uncharacterized protein n=1 Tax=Gluconacetobacter dulcium TaxID=2729096 RepID=A0A7W4IIK3_9PROT|nr:hypothetical protein [Gluconacetobacter dulcium]MBB2163563.1 hypothetical protein [Gluconacetobacter dulcium]MBB2193023.1 hypothetical protein [Gluconacetobacter dulcium]